MSQRPISADKISAIRAAIKASLSRPEICRQYQISPATYHRIKAASVRDDAAEESPRTFAPRPGTMQIEQLCQVFPDLPVHEQTRVAEDVRQAAQATLYSSPRPRPTSVAIELENALARARATPGESISLSRRAWVLVDGDPEAEMRVLPRRKGRADVLLAGLKLARDDVEETDDNHGGREADPGLLAFVSLLGTIYETAANAIVTFSIDPMSGALNSPFGRFVLEALRIFYPDEREIPPGTVRTLVQHLAQFKPELETPPPKAGAGLARS